MTEGTLDTVIVGAGQAGLGTSYYLQLDGRKHVVLERGRVGETWRTQRWDSFQLNTPNFFSTLPGLPYEGAEPDGFWRHDELVRGISPVPGLYFVGFPWLNSRKSGLIVGISEDAGYIAKAIAQRVAEAEE